MGEFRNFKIISINNKKVKHTGRYKTKTFPFNVVEKAFRQLSKKYNTNELTLTIKETTQGSLKKEYGPYRCKKVKVKKPVEVKYKGKNKPVLMKTIIHLVKKNKHKGGGNNSNMNSETANAYRRFHLAKIDKDNKFNININLLGRIGKESSEFHRQYDQGILLIDMMSMKINKNKNILTQLIGLLKNIIFCKSNIKKITNPNMESEKTHRQHQLDELEKAYNHFKTQQYPSMVEMTNYSIKQALTRVLNKSEYGPIELWDVSNVTDMSTLFQDKGDFNEYIGGWDVSNVTNMNCMFVNCFNFNQDISSWDVSNVTDMSGMFRVCETFNKDIGGWDVSKVTNMEMIFNECKAFNQNIGSWDVSKVTDMNGMFSSCHTFNQYIGSWDVSKVTDMNGMFSSCHTFNQYIGSWDVSNVTIMSFMFFRAMLFNKDISKWNVSNETDMNHMFTECPIIICNKCKRKNI
jgi:surface protein